MKSVWTEIKAIEYVSPGVFGVFDEENKRVYISCSNNLILGIATVVTKIKKNDHVCSNMASPIVQILYQGENQGHEGTKVMESLRAKGYQILNGRTPILLEARVRSLMYEKRLVAVVTLRSSRGNERIVAAFETMPECQLWVSDVYPNGFVDTIQELDTELTKQVQKTYA